MQKTIALLISGIWGLSFASAASPHLAPPEADVEVAHVSVASTARATTPSQNRCTRRICVSATCTALSTGTALGTTIWYGATHFSQDNPETIAGITMLALSVPIIFVISAFAGRECGQLWGWLSAWMRDHIPCLRACVERIYTCEDGTRAGCFETFLCQQRLRAKYFQGTYCQPSSASNIEYVADALKKDLLTGAAKSPTGTED